MEIKPATPTCNEDSFLCESDPVLRSPTSVVLATPDSQGSDNREEPSEVPPPPLTNIHHDHSYFSPSKTTDPSQPTSSSPPAAEDENVLSQELFSDVGGGHDDGSAEKAVVMETSCHSDITAVEEGVACPTHLGKSESAIALKQPTTLESGDGELEGSVARPMVEPKRPVVEPKRPVVEPEGPVVELERPVVDKLELKMSVSPMELKPDWKEWNSGEQGACVQGAGDPTVSQIIAMLPCLDKYVEQCDGVSGNQLHLLAQKLIRFSSTVNRKQCSTYDV